MKMRGLDENSASVFIGGVSYYFILSAKSSRRRRQGSILVRCWCFLNRFLLTQRSGYLQLPPEVWAPGTVSRSEPHPEILTIALSWRVRSTGESHQILPVQVPVSLDLAPPLSLSSTCFVFLSVVYPVLSFPLFANFAGILNAILKRDWRERSCHTVKPEA